MEISRENPTTIKLQFRSTTLSIGADPKPAQVRLATQLEPEVVATGDERIFQGPGEYETAGIMIDGVPTSAQAIAYHVMYDGYQVACLAFTKAEDVTDAMIEQLQPSQVVCVWSEEENMASLTALLARFESLVLIPVSVLGGVEKLALELQLKPESIDRLKLNTKDFAVEQQRLIELT